MTYYDGSLEGLFTLLGRCRRLKADEELSVSKLSSIRNPQGELFELEAAHCGGTGGAGARPHRNAGPDCPVVRFDRGGRNRSLIDLWEGHFPAAEPSRPGLSQTVPQADTCGLSTAAEFFELSSGAYYHFIACWMSGLPVETELIRFARKVIAAAEGRGKAGGDRTAADRRSRDRSDPAVERVLAISAKVCLEIHRLTGLLRFTPAGQGGSADTRPDSGFYAARCAPDYFILPALAEHFRLRFGAVPWIVIDERRSLALTCNGVKSELLLPLTAFALNGEGTGDPPAADPAFPLSAGAATDTWENLWRKYHRSINIETRENPRLQRRFMPVRYWKYLPECNE